MNIRNIVLGSIAGVLLLVGGISFYIGKSGAVSADYTDANCKYYAYTDRKSYNPGQTVSIGIKNDKYSKCTLELRSDTYPWTIIDENGSTVYKKTVGEKLTSLAPGEKYSWQWDMRTATGGIIDAGDYKVKFNSPNKSISFTVTNY